MVNTWEERRLLGMAHFILSNQTEAKERRLTMDECITKEMTKSLLKAFEGMNESLEDFQKACFRFRPGFVPGFRYLFCSRWIDNLFIVP